MNYFNSLILLYVCLLNEWPDGFDNRVESKEVYDF